MSDQTEAELLSHHELYIQAVFEFVQRMAAQEKQKRAAASDATQRAFHEGALAELINVMRVMVLQAQVHQLDPERIGMSGTSPERDDWWFDLLR